MQSPFECQENSPSLLFSFFSSLFSLFRQYHEQHHIALSHSWDARRLPNGEGFDGFEFFPRFY